jgi:glycolate oxidase FAD binding subunit
LPVETLREAAKKGGGHVTLFRGDAPADGAFSPLPPALLSVHRNLKQRFDPRGIFNHGRLYPDF